MKNGLQSDGKAIACHSLNPQTQRIFRASKIDNLLIILKQEVLSTLSINLVGSIGWASPAQVVDSVRRTECVPGYPIKQLEIQAHDRRSD